MRLFHTIIDVYNKDDHAVEELIAGESVEPKDDDYMSMPCCIDLDLVLMAYKVPGDTRRSEYTKIEWSSGMRRCINIDYVDFIREWSGLR
jgi:hypothetical protein